ncbi:ubiquitin-conjugating enzyme E2 R2 [Drosophila ananassae]|uniref:ubiquitin-conjugating enzyme E2 R2 n=1 Tax=Drosophila ananassae TaxID=7217 RepID=UPI0013A5E107|nr:ubiquitin-conjugating enzyme E2 R2 [Drosophila ananassae]
MAYSSSMAKRALALEYKRLQEQMVEGFTVDLIDENNLFEWAVGIFGPPDTLYEGGYFKATMKFPNDYPYSPPTLCFQTKVWHPNVYTSGTLCISILHPPTDNTNSGELPCERWNPAQTVRTILLSVISLLNEPNTSSPANVEAALMYRRWLETKGEDKEYEEIIRQQALESSEEARRHGIIVPRTREEYIKNPQEPEEDELDDSFFYDAYNQDLMDEDEDDDEEEDDDEDEENEEFEEAQQQLLEQEEPEEQEASKDKEQLTELKESLETLDVALNAEDNRTQELKNAQNTEDTLRYTCQQNEEMEKNENDMTETAE